MVMVNIIKEESKEHGRALVAITAYSQVANFFLTRKYEYFDWKMLFWQENVNILNMKYEYSDHKIWLISPENMINLTGKYH